MTTLVSTILQNAYRETNLIPIGQALTTNQQNEALDRLNAIIISAVGNEIGDYFDDINIGGTYDQSTLCTQWVPDDARLVLNLSAATSLMLDPSPYEGQRLSFIDTKSNLATYNLTINPNGRLIEGLTTLTLNTNGDSRQWLYRADTGNWVKIVSLASSDTMPFPIEFDDYFITALALRINPRFSQQVPAETIEALKRARAQLRSRYHNYREVRPDLDTRNYLADPYGARGYSDTHGFNTGRIWPYL
jgi:hypothetical protein